MTYNKDIKTSADFENDPNAALDALSQSGFMVFMISKTWFDDERAIKEWRFGKDLKKPMVYIFRKEKGFDVENKFLFDVPNLIGTIYDHGNTDETGRYLQAIISAYEKNLSEKNERRN